MKTAQTAAVKAMAEAARLNQAIRRLAAIVSSIQTAPSSNALRTAAAVHAGRFLEQ